MKIVICSSVVFSDKIIEITEQLEKMGHEVGIPYITKMIREGKLTLEQFVKDKKAGGDIKYRREINVDMIKRYFDLIKESDATLVLNQSKNDIQNYIGGSVLMEMGFAHVLDKPIYLWNDVPKMSYSDEILDTKPLVINGDLTKIK